MPRPIFRSGEQHATQPKQTIASANPAHRNDDGLGTGVELPLPGQSICDALGAPTLVIDVMGKILTANSAWHELIGHPDRSLEGQSVWEFIDGNRAKGGVREGLSQLLNAGRDAFSAVCPFRGADGTEHVVPCSWKSWYHENRQGQGGSGIGGFVCQAQIPQPSLAVAPNIIATTALTRVKDGTDGSPDSPIGTRIDTLTGLTSRHRFVELLEEIGRESAANHTPLALVIIGLDDFNWINDTFGYYLGDSVIQVVAQRLRECVGARAVGSRGSQSYLLTRLSGDEFAILVRGIDAPDDVRSMARSFREQLCEPVNLGAQEMSIRSSAGIASFPHVSTSPGTLLKHANLALRRAKEAGKHTEVVYAEELDEESAARQAIANELPLAIARDELFLAFQPQVDLRTLQISGLECLLRWKSRKLGFVSPADFIPVAEYTGDIINIGSWVIQNACKQIAAWTDAGLPPVVASVNVSPMQFGHGDLIEEIADNLARYDVPSDRLEIEITESLLVKQLEQTAEKLNALKKLGLTIALDDFGTGYSSLNYLTRFPVDKLKLDRSFVRHVTTDRRQESIVRSVVSLSHNIGMRVNVEGVETSDQLAVVHSAGADEVQGYFFSRPLPHEDIANCLVSADIARLACEACKGECEQDVQRGTWRTNCPLAGHYT